MDFTIPEEMKMLQLTARRFTNEVLMPLEREYVTHDLLPFEVEKDLEERVKAMGMWALSVPSEFGGGGVGPLGMWLLEEEVNRALLGDRHQSRGFEGEPLSLYYECNDEQKQKYFYPIIRGEKNSGFFGQTEPNAGSDPASMETTAVRQGDHYTINGQKAFMCSPWGGTHVDWEYGCILAVTDKEKRGRGGITAFIVDRDTPGFKIGRSYETIGGCITCDLHFEDARVPVENRIGEEGQGFILGQKWLQATRLSSAASAVGIADRALEMSARHAKGRFTFGQPIASRQAIQWMLADSAVEIHACRVMGYHGSWKAEVGRDIRQESAYLRLYSAEMVGRVLDRAIQVHGAYGTTKDLPLGKMWRSVRHMRLGHGTAEIQRFIIARNLLRD